MHISMPHGLLKLSSWSAHENESPPSPQRQIMCCHYDILEEKGKSDSFTFILLIAMPSNNVKQSSLVDKVG